MHMNKKILFLIAVFIFFVYIFEINYNHAKYNPEFKIAVVQISSAKLKSYITFFDEDLNEISSMKINCGGLSQCWDFPKIIDNKVYMNVKGTDLWPKSHIAQFDLKTGDYKLYNVHQKFNTCFAVDNKNIYAANCDKNANIIKYEISSCSIKKLVIPNMYITHMKIYDENLFAFGNFSYPHNNSRLYIIDTKTMQIKKDVDITNCGYAQFDSIKINNDIYFSNYMQIENSISETDSNIIGKYNLKNNQLEKIILEHTCPKQIILYKNELIISHEDWHGNGKHLSILNLETQNTKSIEIKNAPYQIYLSKDKIYSIDRQKLYKYDLNSFVLEKQINLHTQKKYGSDFFISGFFFK